MEYRCKNLINFGEYSHEVINVGKPREMEYIERALLIEIYGLNIA